MKKDRICIVTQSHLSRNPRVLKEAKALSDNGFEIIIINNSYSEALSVEDNRLIHGYNIRIKTVAKLEKEDLQAFFYRLIKKAAEIFVRFLKIQTPLALGYAAWRFADIARREDASLYICHQELGLYCGVKLLKSNIKVGFDFEDWYSEDLSVQARRSRPIPLLKRLESFALQYGNFCLTTSDAMAAELAKTYLSPVPVTIYNTFEIQREKFTSEKYYQLPLRLFWFSQTIGPGRGLELFLASISKIEIAVEIHLLGEISQAYKAELLGIQSGHPVIFHAMVPPDELSQEIASFDIGLALEEASPKSRNYTITNKFFQYLESGLPVIATPTIGQLEIFKTISPGFLITEYSSVVFAELEKWLRNNSEIAKARNNAISLAWEYRSKTQYNKLLHLVENAISL